MAKPTKIGPKRQRRPTGTRTTRAAAEGGEEGDDSAEDAADEEADAAAEDADAPEFWSAEDKAAWKAVPSELRPVLKKYEQQRVEFVNEKAREAAAVRARAADEVQRANAVVDQAAQWWRQAGPALQRAFADKWSQVDWTALAEKSPAEWARLNQIRMNEAAVLAEANRRGQQDMQAAAARAEQAFQQAKRDRARQAGAQAARLLRQSGGREQDLRRRGQVPVRQRHPGRPHQPDP